MGMMPNRRAGLALMRNIMVIFKVRRRRVAIIGLAMRKAVLFDFVGLILEADRCVMFVAVARRCRLTLFSAVHAA